MEGDFTPVGIDYPGDDISGTSPDDLTLTDIDDSGGTNTVWHSYKTNDIIARGVTGFSLSCTGGTSAVLSGWDNYTVLPYLVTVTAYITDSKGLFLTGSTDAQPFCGEGLKFVHVVRVNRN